MLLGYISDMNAEFGFQLPHKGYAKQLVRKGKVNLFDVWAENAEIESGFHRIMRNTEPGPTPPKWNAATTPNASAVPNTDVQQMAELRKLAMNGDQQKLIQAFPRDPKEQYEVIQRAGKGSSDVSKRAMKDATDLNLSEPNITGIKNLNQVSDVIDKRINKRIARKNKRRGGGGSGDELLVGGSILGAAALGGVGTNRRRDMR